MPCGNVQHLFPVLNTYYWLFELSQKVSQDINRGDKGMTVYIMPLAHFSARDADFVALGSLFLPALYLRIHRRSLAEWWDFQPRQDDSCSRQQPRLFLTSISALLYAVLQTPFYLKSKTLVISLSHSFIYLVYHALWCLKSEELRGQV